MRPKAVEWTPEARNVEGVANKNLFPLRDTVDVPVPRTEVVVVLLWHTRICMEWILGDERQVVWEYAVCGASVCNG